MGADAVQLVQVPHGEPVYKVVRGTGMAVLHQTSCLKTNGVGQDIDRHPRHRMRRQLRGCQAGRYCC